MYGSSTLKTNMPRKKQVDINFGPKTQFWGILAINRDHVCNSFTSDIQLESRGHD